MDITTEYCGLKLKNPIVVSASPLTRDLAGIKAVAAAGAGAMVLHSLFEEEIDMEALGLDKHLNYGSESFAEATSYFPELEYASGADRYLELIREGKKAVDIPIIASLNGTTPGGWVDYSRKIEEAGADGLELNVYYLPVSPEETAVMVEERYLRILNDVKRAVRIPVMMKLGPAFSATANIAARLANAGAAGLVLFNRFYQPDLDIKKLEVEPTLTLSTSKELLQRIRWVALLYGRVNADFAVTGGVHCACGVIKSMMAGAKVAMMTSELLEKGLGRIEEIRIKMEKWMTEHEYTSITQMQGSLSQKNVAAPALFERANYIKLLRSYGEDPTGRRM